MRINSFTLLNHQNKEVATIHPHKVKFINQALKDSLEYSGILIPRDRWVQFNNKKIVHINDPLFPSAFCSIFFPKCLKESGYRLIANA